MNISARTRKLHGTVHHLMSGCTDVCIGAYQISLAVLQELSIWVRTIGIISDIRRTEKMIMPHESISPNSSEHRAILESGFSVERLNNDRKRQLIFSSLGIQAFGKLAWVFCLVEMGGLDKANNQASRDLLAVFANINLHSRLGACRVTTNFLAMPWVSRWLRGRPITFE